MRARRDIYRCHSGWAERMDIWSCYSETVKTSRSAAEWAGNQDIDSLCPMSVILRPLRLILLPRRYYIFKSRLVASDVTYVPLPSLLAANGPGLLGVQENWPHWSHFVQTQ
ncbi:hypothetical protein XELAEV_18021658mg [Xenopus laevis]|uniref:Uncharacterized protein n=1 Tax=Xenopus laevis TaxID=8355 RepID=A0A974D2W0_XENLA|nr:hypothetical protein XELAEV_18021658mg [Xenopus laevis]